MIIRHATIALALLAANMVAHAQETFTACALNVDGLPLKILGYSLNTGGPGEEGSYAIGQYLAEKGYDLLAFSEDFNYHDTLMVPLTDTYEAGTHRGALTVSTTSELLAFANQTLRFDTDGLEFLWKKDGFSATDESWTAWTDCHGYTTDGADSLITKGFRYYLVTLPSGFQIDVYTLHMEAETTDEDNACRASQLAQLRDTLLNNPYTLRPKLIMGDTNCRYTRDDICGLLIDPLEATSLYTVADAWVLLCLDGTYPTLGTDALMVESLGYTQGEVVDKILCVNPLEGDRIEPTDIYFDADYDLGDHVPVAVTFNATPSSINQTTIAPSSPRAGIYAPDGTRRSALAPGLNIVRQADGTTTKALIR